jgi:hypothetical protein
VKREEEKKSGNVHEQQFVLNFELWRGKRKIFSNDQSGSEKRAKDSDEHGERSTESEFNGDAGSVFGRRRGARRAGTRDSGGHPIPRGRSNRTRSGATGSATGSASGDASSASG